MRHGYLLIGFSVSLELESYTVQYTQNVSLFPRPFASTSFTVSTMNVFTHSLKTKELTWNISSIIQLPFQNHALFKLCLTYML